MFTLISYKLSQITSNTEYGYYLITIEAVSMTEMDVRKKLN